MNGALTPGFHFVGEVRGALGTRALRREQRSLATYAPCCVSLLITLTLCPARIRPYPHSRAACFDFSGAMNIQEPEPEIHYHFVSPADTCQFLVADPVTKHAVIIDPVLDHKHDPSQGPISTRAADALLELIHRNRYHIDRVLETHALPASLSSAWYLRTQIRERFGYTPRVYIGKSIDFVSRFFARNGVHDSGWAEGFDNVFSDGESLTMGDIAIHVLALPGLSLDHIGYRVGKNVFIGEYIFHRRRT